MGHGSTPSDPWPMWPIRFSWPIWPMTHDPSTHSLLWSTQNFTIVPAWVGMRPQKLYILRHLVILAHYYRIFRLCGHYDDWFKFSIWSDSLKEIEFNLGGCVFPQNSSAPNSETVHRIRNVSPVQNWHGTLLQSRWVSWGYNIACRRGEGQSSTDFVHRALELWSLWTRYRR